MKNGKGKDEKPSHRALIAGLAEFGDIEVRGWACSGTGLSALVAVDPERSDYEAARTPQLIAELGRLVAAAARDKEMAEVEYRVWRDTVAHEVGNDLDAARNAGFESAAKAKGEKAKCPSQADIDSYIRTLPEYHKHYEKKLAAAEAWEVLSYGLEAAKARTWAVRTWAATEGSARPPNGEDEASGSRDTYHAGHGDTLPDLERGATRENPPPLPPMPATVGPPPPPAVLAVRPPGPPPPPTTTSRSQR